MPRQSSMPTRRQALGTLGGALILGSSLGGATTAAAKSDGELPNDSVEYSLVDPFGEYEVPAGDWILHAWGWYTGPDCGTDEEHKAALNNFLTNVDTRVWIDGNEIEDAHQYYSEPREPQYYDVPSGWIVEWEYYTPPKGEGTEHEFTFEINFDEEFWAGWWPGGMRDDRDRCDRRYHGPDPETGDDGGVATGSYKIV